MDTVSHSSVTDENAITFEDLFNLNDIQRLQDEFSNATGVASIITRPDGTPITAPSNFCRLCNDIICQTALGRANCYKSDATLGQVHPDGPIIQPCMSGGLWDAGAAIVVGGRHIANWLIGQVRDETQTEERMRAYAREIGVDEADMLAAFREVPAMSRAQFERVARMLFTLANQLSASAYQNVQQARLIAAREQAESAQRESETPYRELANSITDIFFALDKNLRYTFWNKASEQLCGIAAQDAVGKSIYDLFPDAAEAIAIYREVLTTQEPRSFTSHYRLGDKEHDFEINAYPSQHGLSVFGKDITERQQIAEELRKSQERYYSFISQSHEAIYCTEFDQPIDISLPVEEQIDAIYQYAYMGECNQAMADMYNLPSREALIGQRMIDFHGGKDNPTNRATFRKFIESNYHTIDSETEEVTPQGEKRFFLSNDIGIIENGYLRRIWGTTVDITARKQADAVLRASEERFRQVSALTTDIIYSCLHYPDTGYRIDWIAGATEDTLGYTPAEMKEIGCWGNLVVDADWPLFEQHVLQLPPGATSECELRLRVKNGDIVWITAYTRCLLLEASTQRCLFGALTDITPRKRAEQAFQSHHDLLEGLFESLPVGILVWSPKGQLLRANHTLTELLGYAPEEIATLDAWFSQAYPDPDYRAHVFARWEQDAQFANTIREFQVACRDGSIKDIEFRAAFLPDGRSVVTLADVTARKQAEVELTNTKAMLQAALEQSPVPVALVKMPGARIEVVNPAAQEFLGIADEPALNGTSLFDFIPSFQDFDPDGNPGRVEDLPLARALRGESTFNEERRIVRKDGTSRWELVSAVPIYNPHGEILAGYLIMVDITDRKRADQALRESQAQLSLVIDASNDGIWDWNVPQGTAYFSPRYYTMLGYAPDEFPANYANWRRQVHPDDIAAVEATIQCHLDMHLPSYAVEFRMRTKDGAYRWILGRGKVVERDAEGRAVRMVGTHSDITERKLAEAALRESEERFRIAFHISPDSIIISRLADGKYLEVNEGFARIMGYSREETIGRTSLELKIWINPDDRTRMLTLLQANGYVENLEAGFRRKDGVIRNGLLSARLIQLDGEPCILSVTRDITERQQLEQQLRRQERLAAVGQLAAGIAHDFRNLLTTILLYTQLSQRTPGLPSKVAQALATIHTESKKAADLVQQILDFGGRAMVKLQPLDLRACLTGFIATLQRMLPENIRLTLTADAENYIIEGDAGQIQQALLNLALNSRDAMPSGGSLSFTLTRLNVAPDESPPVAEMRPGAWVRLAVTDTGVGMSDAVATHVFEPFFTTKEVGKGSGLGLAQVFGIVRYHAGYIDFTTAEGKGTTFFIYLPLSDATPTVQAPLSAEAPRGQGETLLLVEDNAKLREAGENMLEMLGYRVLTASHGREALEVYAAHKAQIALVITDIVMPEMDGKTLLLELKRAAPHVKALGITGYAMQESLDSLHAAGFLDVVRKPFEIDAMAHIIRQALKNET
ncbi:MAG TPA: PAS domain S-box protein [Anaerolineae bacterium]|nr:PAS domain S-box protein [Anaerolineae bacterium]HQI86804.1 PAS domain S-box protein [Anaerolineae bacterium]